MAVNASSKRLCRFGEFRVDVKNRILWRGTEIVSLTPKAFDLLVLFIESDGSLLKKDELIERLWGDTAVEESNLARNVSFLRKALGEDPKEPEYIVTVAGHGYRFVAGVNEEFSDEAASLGRTVAIPSNRHRGTTRRLALVVIVFVGFLVPLGFVLRGSRKPDARPTLPPLKTIAVLPATRLPRKIATLLPNLGWRPL